MTCKMSSEAAIDLTVRAKSDNELVSDFDINIPIIKPIPRPPWTSLWYQNLFPTIHQDYAPLETKFRSLSTTKIPDKDKYSETNVSRTTYCSSDNYWRNDTSFSSQRSEDSQCAFQNSDRAPSEELNVSLISSTKSNASCNKRQLRYKHSEPSNVSQEVFPSASSSAHRQGFAPMVDVACCDGPVHFERISNPNFAVTVEHHNSSNSDLPGRYQKPGTAMDNTLAFSSDDTMSAAGTSTDGAQRQFSSSIKTYLCIYCNQSFKSLFCYQKHKKRHLNPVSVDITDVTVAEHSGASENRINKTKDLNVQFFPCKKCGSKFPSYYFVHKHKKICH